MKKHIPIKVLTRLPRHLEEWHKNAKSYNTARYYIDQQLEMIDNKLYNVSWINK